MAQVSEATSRDIDRLLHKLLCQWQRLPEVEAEIDQWDWVDQVVFIEEWPLEKDRLADLERYVDQGALTPEQLCQYEELRRIVEQNRPIIRRLQDS